MSQKFCNILVVGKAQFGRSRCLCRGHESEESHWSVRCRACLIIFKCYSPTWSPDSESMVLGWLGFAWSSRFLQSEWRISKHLVTVMTSTALSPFAQQMILVPSMVLWQKFPNYNILHVHLCGYQITHGMKQCATCRCTNYYDTINHGASIYHGLNCSSHVIYASQTSRYQIMKMAPSAGAVEYTNCISAQE